MKKIASVTSEILIAIIAIAIALILICNISPIYRFEPQRPFSGPDVFNPYRYCPDSVVWKKANFHTHTRISGPLNECPLWPEDVLAAYDSLGYDIVTISNHNMLSADNVGANTYEHGYNFFKYHLLAFGSSRVTWYDCTLPFTASQRQFIIDLTRNNSNLIQLNHPARTLFTGQRMMALLQGYRLIELDSGITTENEYWDQALSAGHYSFGTANDDLHDPLFSGNIARRCNFLSCESCEENEIERCLLSGGFYSMRIPDFGDGDLSIKYAMNKNLPRIIRIGVRDKGDIFLNLSENADSIRFTGKDSRRLALFTGCDKASYTLSDDEPYARATVFFGNGCVIYTNPFARYDAGKYSSPFADGAHRTDWILTAAYNLLLILVCLCILRSGRWAIGRINSKLF